MITKKKKKLILRTAYWSAFAAAVYFPSSLTATLYLYRQKDPEIEEYVQENIETIIEKQEKKIRITYPAERPKIEYLFPEEHVSLGTMGLYDDVKNTIYLPSGILIKPEWDFSDFIATIATFNSTTDVKPILDHELAHFYCDKLKEAELGKNHHLFQIRGVFPVDYIADRLINEGIAEYFERAMNNEDEEPFNFQEWPVEAEQFSDDVIYRGGYALVKPIIDEYGEKGIKYLLFNPPTPDELFAPAEYHEKTMATLSKI